MTHMLRKTLTAALLLGTMGCAEGADDGVIDSRGGTISSDDGRLTLDVPAGALDQGVAVSIVLSDVDPVDAMGPSYQLLPEGTAFRIPATISYTVGDLDMAEFEADSLALVVEKNDTWFFMADQDKEDGMISASAVYLSSFSVVATATDDDEDHDHDHGHGNGP